MKVSPEKKRLVELDGLVVKWMRRCRSYGRHLVNCDINVAGKPNQCSCGWEAVEKEIK